MTDRVKLNQTNGLASSSEPRPSIDQTESSSQGFLSSVPDDHSNQSASSDQTPMFLRDRPELQRKSPWQPIVLSLDGGGIRGLSALYILQELMSKIREEEKRLDDLQPREAESIAGESSTEWNICQLIAVLLGRLRLDIDTCINIYEQVGTYFFQRWRWWRKTSYDQSRIGNAVKIILKQYCKEHQDPDGGQCEGKDLLRQWDFSHFDDNTFKNYSCKVALMAIREGDKKQGEGDKPHLFRSYDHVEAAPQCYNPSAAKQAGVSPGTVQSNPTAIWEACRATSAATFYFNKMIIRGIRYMDGGVGYNNPANFALNEAHQMRIADRPQQQKDVAAALISIGTGHKKPQSRFQNIFSMLKWAQRRITDTQDAHNSVQDKCEALKIPYFRFDVINGLSEMPMNECKKNRTKKEMAEPKSQEKRVMSDATQTNGRANSFKLEPAESSKSRLFPTYKPERYEYTTYERIKVSTLNYCRDVGGDHNNEVNTSAELSKVAKLLVYYRRQREASSGDDWRRFAEHPYKRVNGELRSSRKSRVDAKTIE